MANRPRGDIVGAIFLWAICAVASAAELPEPSNGGPGGQPIALLVVGGANPIIGEERLIDPKYLEDLVKRGYRVETVSYANYLSGDYLRQFGCIILTQLPFAGQRYQVGGERLAHYEANMALVHQYLAEGGGVLLQPANGKFGEAYAECYNKFLALYNARLLPQQLRHDSESKNGYAAGLIIADHPLGQGLSTFLYPTNVLRWDHAYSTNVFSVGPEWTAIALGKPGAGTHQALDNSRVGAQLTAHRTVCALRSVGKGLLAVSAIHAYYTLTHVYHTDSYIGENNTGIIAGVVLHGETGGRASDYGKLLDRAYRFLATNSAKHGIGGGQVELPPQPPPPSTAAVIDWHTAKPPPTWRHRVIATRSGERTYYDELPDPLVQGELKYYKALIGPRTSLSRGSGTVRQYREAALKAGYAVVVFCEPLADIDRANGIILHRTASPTPMSALFVFLA